MMWCLKKYDWGVDFDLIYLYSFFIVIIYLFVCVSPILLGFYSELMFFVPLNLYWIGFIVRICSASFFYRF